MKWKIDKEIIVGVSGGPDSMYLLESLKNKFLTTPIAVHVNYKLRESAERDQKIVEEYCNKNNIDLYIFDEYDKFEKTNNLQESARNYRLDCFAKVSKITGVKRVALGHHKNDFIETAIMQHEKSDNLLFYGIKKQNKINDLIIVRPLLNIYKNEIYNNLHKLEIPYGEDESNKKEIYKRNQIRLSLEKKSEKDLDDIFKYFNNINRSNISKIKLNEKQFKEWKTKGFEIRYFINDLKDKHQAIYKLLSLINEDVRGEKITSITKFIENNKGGSSYRLSGDRYLLLEKGKIIVRDNNGNGK